jgi:hypothetical protein
LFNISVSTFAFSHLAFVHIMPRTESQSPGPSATPKTALASQDVKSKVKDAVNATAKTRSTGSVVIEKQQGKDGKTALPRKIPTGPVKPTVTLPSPAQPKDAPKEGTASATKSQPGAAPRQRRRPRKLNKESSATQTPTSQTAPNEAEGASGGDDEASAQGIPTAELEALKSRVRGLEAKVEELYQSGGRAGSGARSPRRRGKGRKGSNTQVPTVASTVDMTARVQELDDDEEEADEELVRLEGELEVAKRDLESYRPRLRNMRTNSGETEYVEEILRGTPGVEEKANTGDRQVTLTGSYRIPLPASVNVEDVKTIQSGVTAAQNVAKSFLEQRRARQQASVQTPDTSSKPPKTARTKAKPSSSALSVIPQEQSEEGTKSWGEWFGGYSMAISRAVKSIEAEAAIESQRLSDTGSKTSAGATGGNTGRTSQGNTPRASTKASARSNRPPK